MSSADRPPSCPTKHQSRPSLPNSLNRADNRPNLLRPMRVHNSPKVARRSRLKLRLNHNLKQTLNNQEPVSLNRHKTVGAGTGSDPDINTGKVLPDRRTGNLMARRARLKRSRPNPKDQYNRTNRDNNPLHPSCNVGNSSSTGWISVSSFLSIMKRSRSRSYINSYAQR